MPRLTPIAGFLLGLSIFWAASAGVWAEEITASVAKMRGDVSEQGTSGSEIPRTGTQIGTGVKLTVPRFGIAVYKIAEACVIKQEPQCTLSFTRLTKSDTPTGHEYGIDVALDKGDFYSSVKFPDEDNVDCHVITSRIEAITHGAVFKISHFFSTSTVMVREGTVVVLYCHRTKRAVIHAGEVFVVTDCQGVLRWFTDDELRQMTLFAAVTGSAFDTAVGGPGMPLHVAVLAPEIPLDLPVISP